MAILISLSIVSLTVVVGLYYNKLFIINKFSNLDIDNNEVITHKTSLVSFDLLEKINHITKSDLSKKIDAVLKEIWLNIKKVSLLFNKRGFLKAVHFIVLLCDFLITKTYQFVKSFMKKLRLKIKEMETTKVEKPVKVSKTLSRLKKEI